MGVLLTSLVVTQLVCHTPRTGLDITEMSMVGIIQYIVTSPPPPPPQAMQGEKIRLSQTWLVDISHLFLVISSSCNVFIFAVQVSLLLVGHLNHIYLSI